MGSLQRKKQPPRTLEPVYPNTGVEVAYRASMDRLIKKMCDSTEFWVEANFKKHPPAMLKLTEMAEDATPSQFLAALIKILFGRWQKTFNKAAPILANKYIRQVFSTSDVALKTEFYNKSFSVDFVMTPPMKDALNASISENVGLIRSIPQQYFKDVEGIVMRSYSEGRDLHTMTKELKTLYPQCERRAVIIARDQCNKANSVVNQARSLELGLTKAIWVHSRGGKVPRVSHVAASGKEFDIAKGCLIEGEYILPGQKINCRCGRRIVLPI